MLPLLNRHAPIDAGIRKLEFVQRAPDEIQSCSPEREDDTSKCLRATLSYGIGHLPLVCLRQRHKILLQRPHLDR